MKNNTNKKEVKIMRKMIMIMFFVVLSVVLIQGIADAKVTGKACSTCHTMHNSQNGADIDTAGPFSYLLRGYASGGGTSCWGCHTDSSSSSNVATATTGAPLIDHNASTDLAGGNFGWITGTKSIGATGSTMSRGHNVIDTEVQDNNFDAGEYPPGDNNTVAILKTNFTCAGVNGCHGDRTAADEYTALKGAHHFVDDMLKFGTIDETSQAYSAGALNGEIVGSSYRFLKGVKGGEDSLWEGNSPSATVHNEYKGALAPDADGTISSPGSTGTISGLCNECHTDFHGTAEMGGSVSSPFERHPTDIALPTTGDYAGYTSYDPAVPIARTDIPTAAAASGMADATVMCLSCHRAHASQFEDMLRFDYTLMIAGNGGGASGTGCFVCHTGKDGS